MKIFKKLFALLLAVILVCSCFASCSKTKKNEMPVVTASGFSDGVLDIEGSDD